MKTIQIGDKKLKDISQEDLLEVVIIEGVCAVMNNNGVDIWAKPVVTDFDNSMFYHTVVLCYASYRVSDKMKSPEMTFYLNHEEMTFHYVKGNIHHSKSERLKIETVKFLLQQGYDLPIY